MRKMLVCLLFVFALSAEAQIQKMYIFDGDVTTAWTTISKSSYAKIVQFDISNDDASNSTDTLWVAFNADTTRAYRWPMLTGETTFFESVYLDAVRVRMSAGTAHVRIRYH